MDTLLDTLPLWAALLPLGLYLLALGCVQLRGRPLVLSGVWDGILLGGSLAGLALVGPLALCVLVSRPRLIVYNITVDQLRPLVAELVSALDPAARWAGESAALPTRGLQLHIDGNGSMRSVSVVAVGERMSLESWGEFGRRLRQGVARLRVRSSPWGPIFTAVGGAVIVLAVWSAYAAAVHSAVDPQETTDAGARRSVGT